MILHVLFVEFIYLSIKTMMLMKVFVKVCLKDTY